MAGEQTDPWSEDADEQQPAPRVGKATAEEADPWRLGHRRPWWQWNVLTLFVLLFLLVWVRELGRLPNAVTWLICVTMLIAWGCGPLLAMEPAPRQQGPRRYEPSPTGDGRETSRTSSSTNSLARVLAFTAALAMFVGVFLLGGFVVLLLAGFGALLLAAAGRGQVD
jgi:hypothetical protein